MRHLLTLSLTLTGLAFAQTHPRLWITPSDVPKLQSWANSKNPIYQEGLLRSALDAKTRMDQGRLEDGGGFDYESDPLESYAALFAFMSLIGPEKDRQNYFERSRKLLLRVVAEAEKGLAEGKPYRDPEFTVHNRSRWHGAAWGLTVDWLYNKLSAAEKKRIAKVFVRWTTENMDLNHGYPCSDPGTACFLEGTETLMNTPDLLKSERGVRWSQNNFYTAHTRNAALMALSLNAEDDPTGTLQKNLNLALGRHLYVIDHALSTVAKGGLAGEGFEYSPQSMGYVAQLLLALHTSRQNTLPQSQFRNPFWKAYPQALMGSLLPRSTQDSDAGQVYQALWYGDGQENHAPDSIEALGPLGIYARLNGDQTTAAGMRWIQTMVPPGGKNDLASRARGGDSRFTSAILYFLLFDPQGKIQDPRPQYPTHQKIEGIGKILARTDWSENASGMSFTSGWNTIDHQAADALSVDFFFKGEWILKKRVGYGFGWSASDNQNAPLIQNDPAERDDYRKLLWTRGSGWLYRPSGDAKLLASSFGKGYTYAQGDATAAYNSDYEDLHGVTQVLRSVLWIEPGALMVFDQLATEKSGRFKKLAFNFPTLLNLKGRVALGKTGSGQTFSVTSLLPEKATLTVKTAPAREGETVGDPDPSPAAHGEPAYQRLTIEATGAPQQTQFLTVFNTGKDTPVLLKDATGLVLGNTLICFATSEKVQYQVPAGVQKQYIVGLKRDTPYTVNRSGSIATVQPGSGPKSDSAGVLVLQE
ncbi:hypothetical protein [Deinococcus roseus]|uniref:Uncharacterized protein n=1 Tax=Deinococcus roseus TaxID=392414 RepID=A0ABQ2D241_9DEIO|nr:hypothetical protein [Deinococcus roseus]GGJ39096.1 hypothetical protein GCM10008938_26370 [Deinococcus roseus]